MTCKSLFNGASKNRKHLDAPVRIYPKCHPGAALDVYVDSVKGTIILCCAKCDRLVETIHPKRKGK